MNPHPCREKDEDGEPQEEGGTNGEKKQKKKAAKTKNSSATILAGVVHSTPKDETNQLTFKYRWDGITHDALCRLIVQYTA